MNVGFKKTNPTYLNLRQNYPNPFNGETAIAFELPREERVELEIFNIAGQRVRLYAPGPLRAGAFRQARKLLFLK